MRTMLASTRLDEAGHDVGARALRGHDEVDTRRTAELRDANDARLDILPGDHHEVGELVDDDDEVGHLGGRIVVMIELAGSLLFVEGRDLADADALEDLEAALHLGHRPLQSARRRGRIVVMIELAGSLLFVEGRDLADADALEDLEAALHLGHRPLQSARRLLGLGDNRDVQVRTPMRSKTLRRRSISDTAHCRALAACLGSVTTGTYR